MEHGCVALLPMNGASSIKEGGAAGRNASLYIRMEGELEGGV